MSWFERPATRRGLLALVALSCLSGCGFRPLYAARGPSDWDPDLAAISVSPMHDRSGQILTLALRENLNPSGTSVPARWRLDTNLTISRADLGIQRNATTTGSEVYASVTFTLIEIKSGKQVYASTSRATSDYDRLVDSYATQVAGDDAQDRALHQVADEMSLRLALFVRQQRVKASNP
jgi:LPS-assembly lipoprotein